MSDLHQWTPIQEGRFHLRNKRPDETLQQYVQRVRPTAWRKYLPHVRSVLKLATAEKDKQGKK